MTRLAAILLTSLLWGCAGLVERGPEQPSPTEIVQMAQSGVSADTILRRMRESNAVYRLSASQLADLRDQGVPDEVIDYMQRTHLRDARYREGVNANRHYPWTFGPYWRHSPYYWRHPYWW